MNLLDALRLNRGARVALVGAGGKTTALFQLAHQFDGPVVVTASTHLGGWQVVFADHHLIAARPEDIEKMAGQINGVTLFTGPAGEDDRFAGLDAPTLDAVHRLAETLDFPVIIEADGSRQRPVKAPAEHEPVIPAWANTVIVVSGLAGLGKPLDAETVHRPEQFAVLAEIEPGQPISAAGLARVLAHPTGGRKNIPQGARRVALLNQADDEMRIRAADEIADQLLNAYDAVLIASLAEQNVRRVIEPVGAVILAAGGSSRYGQAKMLLPWRGKPLVRHAAEAALAAGLERLVVVLGAESEAVRVALQGLNVEFVENPEWQSGQSTSVRRGLSVLPPGTGAALFLLGDQPLVTGDVIRALIERHAETLAAVVAPRVDGRRANPVLFDRVTFNALAMLQGDTGGRAIFERFGIEYVDREERDLLLDVDTPEDYERLKGLE